MSEPYDQPIYFIGIALPEELDRQVSEIQWKLRDKDKNLLKPLLPHVTLLHPPSLRGIMPDDLIPQVQEVAGKYLPLTLALVEISSFNKYICYIRVQSQGLFSLQSQLVKLLPPEARAVHYKQPYAPHITLAQAYEPHKLDMEMLQKELCTKLDLPQQFTVDAVSYFKRILPREYRAQSIV
jgi:2'-5' RNA ligase